MTNHLFAQADSARLPLPDASVDLVVGSPPYSDARLYLEDGRDLGISRNQYQWVDWMLGVTAEALRVTRGAVIWVCAGVTRDRNYWPCCEGLLWEAHKRGWLAECPVYWHRVGIPGSGGDQWFRKDVEYALCFKRVAKLPWSDNTACGAAPRFHPGGRMSNRLVNGERVRAFSKQTRRDAAGGRDASDAKRPMPELSNPGNLIDTGNGAALGSQFAHENEAPYPEAVPEFFIKSLCPPGGLVLDPFSGSGTTASVAARLGRVGIGFDLRASQCRLGRQRLERPHAPVIKKSAADRPLPLFTQGGG